MPMELHPPEQTIESISTISTQFGRNDILRILLALCRGGELLTALILAETLISHLNASILHSDDKSLVVLTV